MKTEEEIKQKIKELKEEKQKYIYEPRYTDASYRAQKLIEQLEWVLDNKDNQCD